MSEAVGPPAAPVASGAGAPIPLPRGFSVLLTAAAAMIVVAGLREFSHSVGPIFLALVIVVVVSPLQRGLLNRGAPSWLAMVAMFAVSFGILAVIVGSLVWSTTQLVSLVASDEYTDQLNNAQQEVATDLDRLGVSGDDLQRALDGLDLGAVAGQITTALSGLLGVTSAVSLLVITLLFMILDAEKFGNNLRHVAVGRPEVAQGLQQFARQTRSYFVVSTVFGLIVAALDVAALTALGVPLALVWGVLSLITNYIPNIGFVIGLIPPALLAFFEGGWQLSLWVGAVYLGINVVIQSIIQPKFVGDAVGLSTTLTFLSLIFWGWVLGPLGALLAVPMTLLAKALLVDIDPSTRWADPLISLSRTPPATETQPDHTGHWRGADPERSDDLRRAEKPTAGHGGDTGRQTADERRTELYRAELEARRRAAATDRAPDS